MTEIESYRKANSLEALRSFRDKVLQNSDFSIQKIDFKDQSDWYLKDGVVKHKSGGFFEICGFVSDLGQEHLVLHQPQGAFNGLILYRQGDQVYVMVQARVEPGNTDICQYGPTIQSTPANYKRLHKGKPTPYLEYFFESSYRDHTVHLSKHNDLGERYYQKTKDLQFIELNSFESTAENMIWVELGTLLEGLSIDHLINTDLRSMLGVFDWDQYLETGTMSSNKESLALPAVEIAAKGSLVPLTALSQWKLHESGAHSLLKDGISFATFETYCTNREVQNWRQPLICSETSGQYTLCVRSVNGNTEVLISMVNEFGIEGPSAMPSFSNYNGENGFDIQDAKRLLITVNQSEEGGRFFMNEAEYTVVEVQVDYPLTANQTWLSISEFKELLKRDVLASIQLRGMASMISKLLNPNALLDHNLPA
jgi:oxidase EvaA